ncbi:hypothetical protein HK097_010757 [Rhizophlyctis rosea]|uniref:BTB domain-containing protein n=1 Tax=Rhizophlyctis rosea TaxID=64517 RepID=A0AAD5S769_9FUNG|nr:hypothetical protein HK097_010757 [Rhizophlyctis rosea]
MPMSGTLCSTAKHITIREVHTDTEISDLGLVTWTFEGCIPSNGNAAEAWQDARDNDKIFRIETDRFGPLDCSWMAYLEADFSEEERPTYVGLWIAPVIITTQSHQQPKRVFRLGKRSIRDGVHVLFKRTARETVRSLPFDEVVGVAKAIEVSELEDVFRSSTFLSCFISLEFHSTPYGVHTPLPVPPIHKYLSNSKLSDVTLNITAGETPVPISAHRMVLAASSDFFRSKFDLEEHAGGSKYDITDFTEPCIRAMLEFMYTQRIDQHMPEALDDKLQLIAASEYYQVSGMQQFVTPYILDHIAPDTVIRILGFGYKFRATSDALAKGAGKYLRDTWSELATKEKFSNSVAVDGIGDLLKYALQGK